MLYVDHYLDFLLNKICIKDSNKENNLKIILREIGEEEAMEYISRRGRYRFRGQIDNLKDIVIALAYYSN